MGQWVARCVLMLALALGAYPAMAQELWNGADYGMSPAQVQQRFPHASAPEVPDELAGGEVEGLRLDGVEMAGHDFDAAFFFAGDALAQVTLSLRDVPDAAGGMRAFEAVAGALAARHGAPVDSEWTREPFERRRKAWQVQGATVAVVYLQAGTSAIVNVVHQVAPPSAPPPIRLRSGN